MNEEDAQRLQALVRWQREDFNASEKLHQGWHPVARSATRTKYARLLAILTNLEVLGIFGVPHRTNAHIFAEIGRQNSWRSL